MPRRSRQAPNSFLVDPSVPFVDGEIIGDTADHHAARRAQELARRIAAACDERGLSVRGAADATRPAPGDDPVLDYSALYAVVRGDAYPDLRTLGVLETVLGPLWE